MSAIAYRGDVSHGAWLTYQALARSRPHKGGLRQVGRCRLASILRRTTRQISRYVAELRAAGYIEVIPPRRLRTPKGWRTIEVNRYRLHRRSSPRNDMRVIPPPSGVERRRPAGEPTPLPPPFAADPTAASPPTEAFRAARAALRATRRRR
jgi:hypothetical protein